MKQLPLIPSRSTEPYEAFIESRLLELCLLGVGHGGFAASLGWKGRHSGGTRKCPIQSEIDAFMFRLYGLGRSEVGYIMGTFDALRNRR